MLLAIEMLRPPLTYLVYTITISHLMGSASGETLQNVTANGGIGGCWTQDGLPRGVLSFQVRTDGHSPMGESGLPTLMLCPHVNNRAVVLNCDQGWNHDTWPSMTVNGQQCLAWTLLDDNSGIGAVCSGSWADGGTDALDCKNIGFTGVALLNTTSVAFFINEKPSTTVAAATIAPAPPGAARHVVGAQNQPSNAAVAVATASPSPSTTQNHVSVTGGVQGSCWGSANQLSGGIDFQVNINGEGPAAEVGLPELTICGTLNGSPVNLECPGGWNFDNLGSSIVNGGKCMKWATKDDQPNVGCITQFSSTNGGNATIDCTKVELTVTAQVNGTDAVTTLSGKSGPMNNAPPPAPQAGPPPLSITSSP
ncbi:hypothetical protein SeLEV6574_g02109 [Synchytrium endobioticum]|nr:hypothetical protein SeLEV6574_g02109 [Synchytrium endobioticum]